MQQVTRSNLDRHPFVFKVIPENKEQGTIWFRVAVSPRQERDSWCVSGALRIMKGDDIVGTFKIAGSTYDGAAPCAPEREEGRWTFAFTISRGYLKDSRFTFFDTDCEMPAFDGYWLNLQEFYKD